MTSTICKEYLVNDSPALKRADVGFAMGSGTDAAKEAGDLVIIDDNFLSIKNAIWYGRTIYENILKFVKFQLSINVAAVLVSSLLVLLGGIEEPLKVTHLLFVNLVMDSLGSLMLGAEPAMDKYMKMKPRRRDESIVSKPMFIQFCITGAYLFGLSWFWFKSDMVAQFFMLNGSLDDALFKTGYFAMFMFAAILNGFNVRNNGFNILKDIKQNPGFFKVMIAMLVATFILCQSGFVVPVVGQMFGTTPIGLVHWIVVIVVAITIIPVDMLRKLVCRTYKNV